MTAAEALSRTIDPDGWRNVDHARTDDAAHHGWAEDKARRLLENAEGYLSALRALGFAIVPIEATKQMIAAGDMLTYREERFKVSAVWREMVSAYAPDAENGKKL